MTGPPFARVFAGFSLRHATGILRLEQDARRYALYWHEGAIADADSSNPEDTFGRVALEAGLIASSAVGESLRRMAQNPARSQKDILVELGALKGDAVDRALRLTLTRRVLRIFALPSATYSTEEADHGRHEGLGGPIEPRWSLYRGLRSHYDERRLSEELAELGGHAIKLHAAADLEGFGFGEEERAPLSYLGRGYWDVFDLTEACASLPRQVVLAVVQALHAFEQLDVQPASKVNRLRKKGAPGQSTSTQSRAVLGLDVPPGPQPSPRGTSTGLGLSQTIEPVPSSKGTIPPSQVYTSASGTGPAAVVPPLSRPVSPVPSRASSALPPILPPGSVPVQPIVPPRSAPLPPVTAGRRPSAPAAPVQSGTPPGGLAVALRDQITAKLVAVEGNADHFTLLEVGRDATSTQIKESYLRLAKTYHPDRLNIVKLESLRPQVERIFARLSDAFAAIGDEARRKDYLGLLAQGGEAAVKRREDDEAARATRLLTAEEHFKKGEMALRRQSYQTAVDEFQAAVELNDSEAEHYALLAWAKFLCAADKQAVFPEVQAGFKKAMKLNDRCVPAFFHFGQVFRALGDTDKAYAYFQKVLSLSENHVDAAREVRLIEMRKKTTAKGLFDRFKKK
jgi:hypothetical protein